MSSSESGSTRRGDDEFSDAANEPESFAIIRRAWEKKGQDQRAGSGEAVAPDNPGNVGGWVKDQYTQERRAGRDVSGVNESRTDRDDRRDTMDLIKNHEQVALQVQETQSAAQVMFSSGAASQGNRRRLAARRKEADREPSVTADYLAARGDLNTSSTQAFEPDMNKVSQGLAERIQGQSDKKMSDLRERIQAARDEAEKHRAEREAYRQLRERGNDGQGR
jgi:hypothetical protein